MAVTQPSVTTGYAADERRQIALRWVFPSARVSVLHDGHRFGRDTACESVLPGSEISRVHACVRVTSPVPVLQDLGSRNGVFVGGQRVQERPLGPGDVVRLGEWVGILEERTGAQSGADSELHAIGPGWYGGSTLSAVMEPLRAVAPTDLPIAIQGETGTGKEGAARQVHAWSGRRGPLIAVDCGALPEQLAEAQLFGQRKGAFTGADRASLGHLRAADGGTLFLDEVLNLPLPADGPAAQEPAGDVRSHRVADRRAGELHETIQADGVAAIGCTAKTPRRARACALARGVCRYTANPGDHEPPRSCTAPPAAAFSTVCAQISASCLLSKNAFGISLLDPHVTAVIT